MWAAEEGELPSTPAERAESAEKKRLERWYSGVCDSKEASEQALQRCVQLISARGDDASALSIAVKVPSPRGTHAHLLFGHRGVGYRVKQWRK